MSAPIFIDRYPGLRPFDETEKNMFFGRSIEVEELSQSINVNDLFVIHGESGLGKSSLINAGLVPLLRERDFLPILLRFKDRTKSPLHQVLTEIKKAIEPYRKETEKLDEVVSLWHLIKLFNRQYIRPILIFDQFEEFGYYNEKNRLQLIKALAELQKTFSLPQEGIATFPMLLEQLASPEAPSLLSTEGGQAGAPVPEEMEVFQPEKKFTWYEQPVIKLIFSLRSDRLCILEDFARYLPGMMHARYQLKPIQLGQAEQIIVMPAVMESEEGIRYKTKPFQYQPDLIKLMIEVVRDKKRNTIETTQLQMICQEIELMVLEKQSAQEKKIVTMSTQDLTEAKLKEVVNNFYKKQLEKIINDKQLSGTEYTAIRILLEKRLLLNGSRVPLAEASIDSFFKDYFGEKFKKGISEAQLKYIRELLLKLRLIRDQSYGDVVFYEISHDTLVGPIENERKGREKEEKLKQAQLSRQKRERDLLEQKRKADEETRTKEKEITKQRQQITLINEQKKIAEKALRKARRLQTWVAVILTGFSAFIGYFLVDNIRQNNHTSRLLSRIYSNEADKYYEKGEHQLAYKFWKNSSQQKTTDSILSSKPFYAWAGSSINISSDLNFVIIKNRENAYSLWSAGDQEGDKIAEVPNSFFLGFIYNKPFYFIRDSINRMSIYQLPDNKKLSFKTSHWNLDTVKKESIDIDIIGDYLYLIYSSQEQQPYLFLSIENGKPLARINRFFDSTSIAYDPYFSISIIPLNADSSQVLYTNGETRPVLIDLKKDKARFLDQQPWANAIRSGRYIAFKNGNWIQVYDNSTGQTRRIYKENDSDAFYFSSINNGSSLLIEKTPHLGSDQLIQVDIPTGKSYIIGDMSNSKTLQKNNRYYIWVRTDSIPVIMDAQTRNPVKYLNKSAKLYLTTDEQFILTAMDSVWQVFNSNSFQQEDTFIYDKVPKRLESSIISYYRNDTLVLFNLATRRTIRINEESVASTYGDKFMRLRTYDLKTQYALQFIDSTKRTPAFLQDYFSDYLNREFKRFTK